MAAKIDAKLYQQKMLKFKKRRRESDCTPSPKRARLRDITTTCNAKASAAPPTSHDSVLEPLLCREKELDFLNTFLTGHLRDRTPGSLYISGPPGTGKTASVTHVLRRLGGKEAEKLWINCLTSSNPLKEVRQRMTNSKKMIVIVLDEIDSLSKDDLYKVFEWPGEKKSKAILIGISNTLDLVDRLPRLLAVHYSPTLLSFAPYTRQEIIAILTGTLKGGVSSLEPITLQYVARKVSSKDGDLRKAIDICRRVSDNYSSDVPATIKDVSSVMADPSSGGAHLCQLPLHQKLIACGLLALTSKMEAAKSQTMSDLYKSYVSVCEKRHIRYCDSEFSNLTEQLEANNVVSIERRGKKPRTVSLAMEREKLEYVVRDVLH